MVSSAQRVSRACLIGCRLAVASLIFGCSTAWALDYQVHGFASQAAVFSRGNNIYGDSTHGSLAFYEFGANGTVNLLQNLSFSAQGLVRDAGKNDNGAPRLDFAFLDYRFLDAPNADAGVRLGRIKNAFGLFNDTRDVIFTRPGITLPSVYLDGQGFRALLFSSDGGQLYGGTTFGNHYVSLVASHGLDKSLSALEKEQLGGGGLQIDQAHLNNFYAARLQDEADAGLWRFAASYVRADITASAGPPAPFTGELAAQIFLLSGRYNAERFSLTSEYSLMSTLGSTSNGGPINAKSEAVYVQADVLLSSKWTVTARYDANFSDRNDRNGQAYQSQTGADRYSRFAHDVSIGLKWLPDEHWGVWTEYHHIDGSATVSPLDNAGRAAAPSWQTLMFMAGYRF